MYLRDSFDVNGYSDVIITTFLLRLTFTIHVIFRNERESLRNEIFMSGITLNGTHKASVRNKNVLSETVLIKNLLKEKLTLIDQTCLSICNTFVEVSHLRLRVLLKKLKELQNDCCLYISLTTPTRNPNNDSENVFKYCRQNNINSLSTSKNG